MRAAMMRCPTCGEAVGHDYERVAEVYLEAQQAGKPVQDAVAREFDVTRNAAAQMIARARHKYGLLPPAPKDWRSRKVGAA